MSLLVAGCAGPGLPAPAPSPPAIVRPAAPPVAPAWIEDDIPGAEARATREGKVLLVDAWAPWCHTCLSMKREVLVDPALGALQDRVVFAAIDTDRPENAPFVARFAVEVWPTFFVIDPVARRVLAVHGGAASLSELRGVIDGALALRASGAAGPFEAALAEGADAFATRRFDAAAAAYERAGAMLHPRASEALLGAIRARHEVADHAGCAAVAEHHLERVAGSAMAADFSYHARKCAAALDDRERGARLQQRVRARLRDITREPPPGATVDDRADALAMLAEVERDLDDAAAARTAIDARVKLLDAAAAGATSPEEAAVFDYMRMNAYQDVGRPEDAVRMLEERTRQTPGNYEPFARLASVLSKIDPPRALVPLRRAIALSYGPRRLRYMEQEAEILRATGDAAGHLAALERVVAGHRALPPGHADPERLTRAEKALEAARAEAAAPRVTSPAAPPRAR